MHDENEKPLENETFEEWLQRTAPLEQTIPSILDIPQWVYENENHESIWITDRKMGWWGTHKKITESKEVRDNLKSVFSNHSPEDYLIILDCHI